MKKENLKEKEQDNTDKEIIQEEITSENQEANDADEENEDEISEDNNTEELERELTESKDKYLRLYSEFENFRRRTAKEKLELINTANEGLIFSLLPVLDDFERAMDSNKNVDTSNIQEGFELIYNKFKNILEQKGLKVMDHSQGIEFDAELHEAITQTPAPKKKLVGKVVDVVEKGYYLGEKVVRFAKVVIGS